MLRAAGQRGLSAGGAGLAHETGLLGMTSEEAAGISGKYFANLQEKQPSASSQDAETARHLWKISAEMVGLSPN